MWPDTDQSHSMQRGSVRTTWQEGSPHWLLECTGCGEWRDYDVLEQARVPVAFHDKHARCAGQPREPLCQCACHGNHPAQLAARELERGS